VHKVVQLLSGSVKTSCYIYFSVIFSSKIINFILHAISISHVLCFTLVINKVFVSFVVMLSVVVMMEILLIESFYWKLVESQKYSPRICFSYISFLEIVF